MASPDVGLGSCQERGARGIAARPAGDTTARQAVSLRARPAEIAALARRQSRVSGR